MTVDGATEDALCVGCGLCCDGTLHPLTRVAPDQVQAVRSIGLEIVNEETDAGFRQPCPMFANGCCSIYPRRPSVCAAYECALLQRVKQGRLTIGAARERVGTAKQLVSRVAKLSPRAILANGRQVVWRELSASLAQLEPAERARAAQAILAIAALDQYLERWFSTKKGEIGQIPAAKPTDRTGSRLVR